MGFYPFNFLATYLVARTEAATYKERLNVRPVVRAAGLAARVLPAPVKDHAALAADPVIGVVAGGLGLQRVLHGGGRVLVGEERLLGRLHCFLLGYDPATAVLDEARADQRRVGVQGKEPARGLPDAAERLELLLDGEGLAGDDQVLVVRGEEEREHLALLKLLGGWGYHDT